MATKIAICALVYCLLFFKILACINFNTLTPSLLEFIVTIVIGFNITLFLSMWFYLRLNNNHKEVEKKDEIEKIDHQIKLNGNIEKKVSLHNDKHYEFTINVERNKR